MSCNGKTFVNQVSPQGRGRFIQALPTEGALRDIIGNKKHLRWAVTVS